jgi:hypothetical protein
MRDLRDAKAMAHTLRAALATKGHKVTNSESLELIARAFGVADWNTLSASIREETAGLATTRPPRLSLRPPKAVQRFSPTRSTKAAPRFPPSFGRRWTGPSPTPTSESMSTRRWSISCLL